MSREYVITFHTHYEALVCKRSFEKTEPAQTGALAIKLIPVPRELSSSCGTAVKLGVKDEAYYIFGSFGMRGKTQCGCTGRFIEKFPYFFRP